MFKSALLNDIRVLEERLHIPVGTMEQLLQEDDWSFTIKLHALIEATVSQLLTYRVGIEELQDVFSALPLLGRKTGKLAFANALNLLDKSAVKFVETLSEIRNGLVHKIANMDFEYVHYLARLNKEKREQFIQTMAFFADAETNSGDPDVNRTFVETQTKRAVWINGLVCLTGILYQLEDARLRSEIRQFEGMAGNAILSLVLRRGRETQANAGKSIEVIRDFTAGELVNRDVQSWPIWEKEVSEFPWHYDEMETCYLLEGDVIVTPDGGEPVRFGKGDLVTFPKGMSCTWKVLKPVRKHYKFG